MNIFCVGLSHHTAEVKVRERYATRPGAENFLRESGGCREALVLATCNRVEVYGVAEGSLETGQIARCLRSVDEVQAPDEPAFYRYEGPDCVQHLFRVASGLDSMVIGETEILGQTKKAYAQARDSGTAGPYLHRLFQRSFRVAKQVRSRTEITRGAVSVGSVAVDLAVRIFGELCGRKVLLLGAGEMSERTARILVSRGVRDLRVSNRSLERAQSLAKEVGGRAIPFPEWQRQCREIDILLSSTASNEPLLTAAMLRPLIADRVDRPLFIIDIAVPRDIAPEVNGIEGVYLYDIDSLQSIAEQSIALRRQQIAAAEAIISEHVSAFAEWSEGSEQSSLRAAGQAHPALAESRLRASES